MAVMLTEKAANEVKRILADQKVEPGTVLRVGVTGGGCSGFSYALAFDKTFDEKTDSKYEYHGVPVVVDKKSALYLDGTTIDFYEGLEDLPQPDVDGASTDALRAFLLTPEGLELARSLPQIRDGQVRRKVVELVRALAETPEQAAQAA